MDDRGIRAALDHHWAASDASNFEEEHEIYREDAVLEYPQSSERIRGRQKFRRPALHSQTESTSQYVGLQAQAISGSPNIF